MLKDQESEQGLWALLDLQDGCHLQVRETRDEKHQCPPLQISSSSDNKWLYSVAESYPDVGYVVKRSTTGNVPVYSAYRNGGTRKLTVIRRIDGDIHVSGIDFMLAGCKCDLAQA